MNQKVIVGVIVVLVLIIGGYFIFGGENIMTEPAELEDEGATYEVVFDATWSPSTHPEDFPTNDHWSGLIGASHNSNAMFWGVGGISTDGIKLMAETGGKVKLIPEVEAAIGNGTANQVLSGPVISTGDGEARLTFNMNASYPLVTLTSMIAPSPDWFVGVNGLNLYEDGEWVESKEIVLYAYDAGTDGGEVYTSHNDALEVREPIELLSKYDGNPFGKFIFTKIN